MKKIIPILIIFIAIILIATGLLIRKNNDSNKNDIPPKKETAEIIKGDPIDVTQYAKIKEQISKTIQNANNYLFEYYPIKNIEDIQEDLKTKFLLDIILVENKNEISIEELEKEKTKYFNDYIIPKKDIIDSNKSKYLYKENKFIKEKTYSNTCLFNLITEKEINNQKQWIEKGKFYYSSLDLKDENNLKYVIRIYKTLQDCKNNKNVLIENENTISNLNKDDLEKIKDKLNKITYTLNNENGIYKLKSIK